MGFKLTKMGVVLDSNNPDELSDFYQKLLGWEKRKYTINSIVFNAHDDGMPFQLLFQYDENYVRPVWPADQGNNKWHI